MTLLLLLLSSSSRKYLLHSRQFLSQINILSHSPAAAMPHQWAACRYSSSQKPKIVVIMGPTGSGKSRLSMDLVTGFFPNSEIINSDKIQVYRGLDITTNKIPLRQQLAVTHHLLGDFDSRRGEEFTPSDFRAAAASAISLITGRRNLPLVVGGSNSFIYALIAESHDPNNNSTDDHILLFKEETNNNNNNNNKVQAVVGQRYDCCFIRIDVSFPVLNRYLMERVEEMMGSGMLEELEEFFKSEEEEESIGGKRSVGLRKAIGVAELEEYFRRVEEKSDDDDDDPVRRRRRRKALEEAIGNIKRNTCELARRQVEKMRRLTNGAGWKMHRVDATEALRAAIAAGQGRRLSGEEAAQIWERQVLHPSVKIVRQFLDDY